MIKHPFTNASANPQYEGHMVDLLNHLTRMLGVTYKLHPVKDSQFGHRQSDGSWNGMIGQLREKVIALKAWLSR